MRYISIIIVFILMSCGSNEHTLTLADLKEGDRVEVIGFEVQEKYLGDSALHMRLLKNVGVTIGLQGTARGPKEANRGISYGFYPENDNFFGLYEPQASMVIVRRLK